MLSNTSSTKLLLREFIWIGNSAHLKLILWSASRILKLALGEPVNKCFLSYVSEFMLFDVLQHVRNQHVFLFSKQFHMRDEKFRTSGEGLCCPKYRSGTTDHLVNFGIAIGISVFNLSNKLSDFIKKTEGEKLWHKISLVL